MLNASVSMEKSKCEIAISSKMTFQGTQEWQTSLNIMEESVWPEMVQVEDAQAQVVVGFYLLLGVESGHALTAFHLNLGREIYLPSW